ncbi:MAG: exodeoxyribonuclease III [Candidatus Bipolaricaulaceae bacterium]
MATYNANSIRTRMPLVADWLRRYRPDVLCIQETRVPDGDFPAADFRKLGYHVVFRGRKGQAGVALASLTEARRVSFGLDDGGPADDDRLVRADIRGIPVVNTYVPQGRSVDHEMFRYKLKWLARLREYFDRHFSPGQPLLWCGDFNVAPEEIDVHNPTRLKNHVDFHPEAREALQEIREWGFEDLLRRHRPGEEGQFTFWDYRVPNALERNLGWRVDHIWATCPLAERSTTVWIDREARKADKPSDHTFVVAEFVA